MSEAATPKPQTYHRAMRSKPPPPLEPGPQVACILDALATRTFRWRHEIDLQDALAKVFAEDGIVVEREKAFPVRDLKPDNGRARPPNASDRPDFFVPSSGIVVEVKVDGGPAEVLRQLFRYAQLPEVSALVLVTGCASHMAIPDLIADKRVHVAWVGGGGFR